MCFFAVNFMKSRSDLDRTKIQGVSVNKLFALNIFEFAFFMFHIFLAYNKKKP